MKNIEESAISESDRIIITTEEIVFGWMLRLKRLPRGQTGNLESIETAGAKLDAW